MWPCTKTSFTWSLIHCSPPRIATPFRPDCEKDDLHELCHHGREASVPHSLCLPSSSEVSGRIRYRREATHRSLCHNSHHHADHAADMNGRLERKKSNKMKRVSHGSHLFSPSLPAISRLYTGHHQSPRRRVFRSLIEYPRGSL